MFSGKYLAIRGMKTDGSTVYLEYPDTIGRRDIQEHLDKINRDLDRRIEMQRKWRDSSFSANELEASRNEAYRLEFSTSPFDRKMFRPDHDPLSLVAELKACQYLASQHDINPASVEFVSINVDVEDFIPEEDSVLETHLRKAALDRLSPAEQRLLKVMHWRVYDKLADRSAFDDNSDDDLPF